LELAEYEVLLIIPGLALYMAWREFLVAEVLAVTWCHHEERLHGNQPE
jgi:hypothetical protein